MFAVSSASWHCRRSPKRWTRSSPSTCAKLVARPAAMQGVGADEGDVLLRNARLAQLLEDRLDREPPHGPERRRRGIVEGDQDACAGADELSHARHSEWIRERLAHGGLLVGDRLEAGLAISSATAAYQRRASQAGPP